jgi:hypothetical protein
MTDVPAGPKPSLFEDFLEIFYAPSRVFARRGASDWGVPLLVLIVLVAILTFATWNLVRPLVEADAVRGFLATAHKRGMTPEQIEQSRSAVIGFTRFVPYIIILTMGILPFEVGLVTWLVGKMVGATESLGEALMITVFYYVPRHQGLVAMAAQAALLPEEQLKGMGSVSIGPARFLDPDTANPGLLALAGRLDLLVIWSTVLIAIGLRVKGKISTAQAAIAAIVVWLLGSLPALASYVRS